MDEEVTRVRVLIYKGNKEWVEKALKSAASLPLIMSDGRHGRDGGEIQITTISEDQGIEILEKKEG